MNAAVQTKLNGHSYFLFAGFAIVAALLTNAAMLKTQNARTLDRRHDALVAAVPEMRAALAVAGPETDVIQLPAEMQALQTIPIFSRSSGYLERRCVDIGDKVKAGDLLAVVQTPEVDEQVKVAEANLRVAQANVDSAIADRQSLSAQLHASDSSVQQSRTNLNFSTIEAKRYQALAADGAVSSEQRDQAFKQFNSDSAQISIAQMSRNSLEAQLHSADMKLLAMRNLVSLAEASLRQVTTVDQFRNITAPCNGVITERFVDSGSLISAGASSGNTQLLSMARTEILRIYVDVPQGAYRSIRTNDHVEISVRELPGRTFSGTVTNISGGLNAQTRTLKVEIKIDNKNGELWPGAFAEVHFSTKRIAPSVIVPSNAIVTTNEGLNIVVVKNHRAFSQPVSVLRDHGNNLEIDHGVKAGDVLLLDPPSNIANGAVVDVSFEQPANGAAHSSAAAK